MEPFEVECPHCEKPLRVGSPTLLGRKVKCPKCKERLVIPTAEELEDAGHVLAEETVGIGNSLDRASGILTNGLSFLTRSKPVQEDYTEVPSGDESHDDSDTGDYTSAQYIPRRPPPFPWDKLMMVVGIPAGLLFFGVIAILGYNGYFSSGTDGRQDATRFTKFAEDAEKNYKWNPQQDNRYRPPTNSNWNGSGSGNKGSSGNKSGNRGSGNSGNRSSSRSGSS